MLSFVKCKKAGPLGSHLGNSYHNSSFSDGPGLRALRPVHHAVQGFAWHPESRHRRDFFVDGAGRSTPPPAAEGNYIFWPTSFPAEAAGANRPDPRATTKRFGFPVWPEYGSQSA